MSSTQWSLSTASTHSPPPTHPLQSTPHSLPSTPIPSVYLSPIESGRLISDTPSQFRSLGEWRQVLLDRWPTRLRSGDVACRDTKDCSCEHRGGRAWGCQWCWEWVTPECLGKALDWAAAWFYLGWTHWGATHQSLDCSPPLSFHPSDSSRPLSFCPLFPSRTIKSSSVHGSVTK